MTALEVTTGNARVEDGQLKYSLFLAGGPGYGTILSNMNSANIVFEVIDKGNAVLGFQPGVPIAATPAGGNYNGFLQSVYVTYSPVFPPFMQYPEARLVINHNVTRNVLGQNLDFIEGVAIPVCDVAIPIKSGAFLDAVMKLRTVTTAVHPFGSSWSTGTVLNQPFTGNDVVIR